MNKKLCLSSALIIIASIFSGCGDSINDAADLNGRKIAAQFGTTGFSIASDIKNSDVRGYKTSKDIVDAIKESTVEAAIIDEDTARNLADKNEELKVLKDSFEIEEYSIAYNKDNEKLGDEIDRVITELVTDGTLDDLSSHWIGEDADKVSYVPDPDIEREGTILMYTNAEFPPYESKIDGEICGFDVDLMNVICDRLQLNLLIRNEPFSSLLDYVAQDENSVAVAAMTVTPEREEKVAFTKSYANSKQVIVVKK